MVGYIRLLLFGHYCMFSLSLFRSHILVCMVMYWCMYACSIQRCMDVCVYVCSVIDYVFLDVADKRAYHAAVMLEERLYVMGGKASEEKFYADTWYRDDSMPVAKISHRPGSNTPLSWFEYVITCILLSCYLVSLNGCVCAICVCRFASTEAGVSFEYRIWDPINYKQLRAWTAVVHKTSVEWLDWRKGGPGNGEYEIYVRAVDPSGNRDKMYIHSDNVYRWYYLSPTPWDIIFGSIGGFIAACIIAYAEYRRRVKKAAMER